MKSVTILCGWVLPSLGGDQPLLGGEFCLGGVDPPWVKAGLPKKGLSPPIEGRSYTQKLVTDLKNVHKNVNFPFHSTSTFVKYQGLKINKELNKGNFCNLLRFGY